MSQSEILLERHQVGASVRVAAVCVHTGIEVVFVAPADAPQSTIESLAASKMAFAKRQRQEEEDAGRGGRAAGTLRRGIIV